MGAVCGCRMFEPGEQRQLVRTVSHAPCKSTVSLLGADLFGAHHCAFSFTHDGIALHQPVDQGVPSGNTVGKHGERGNEVLESGEWLG